jgi:two-component system, LuxR family, response regulator FixJ
MAAAHGPVLIVDDDEAVRNSLKFALELEGLEVLLYRSGAEVLDTARLPRDGCLLIDYLMPAMSGVDLMAALKERCIDLPAILMTSGVTRELNSRARAIGFRTVIEKPLDGGLLMETIREALQANA